MKEGLPQDSSKALSTKELSALEKLQLMTGLYEDSIVPAAERYRQLSLEEIAEMQSQIPALREMLESRKAELAVLEADPTGDTARIEELRTEIEELEFEIEGREEADKP